MRNAAPLTSLALLAPLALAVALLQPHRAVADGRAAPGPRLDRRALVVFGAAIRPDGTPSPQLTSRLRRALELSRAHPRATLIVSGGNRTAAIAEATLMKRWLVDRGVAAGRVLVEPRARHTGENADFSAPLLKSIGARRVTAITSQAHLPRAMFHLRWALRERGMNGVTLEGAGAGPRPRLRDRVREGLKLVRDAMLRMGGVEGRHGARASQTPTRSATR